jgi:hypothetical protein
MKGQRLRTSVAPSSALALAPVLASPAHAVAFFCHRSVVDRDTTKGGATPPLERRTRVRRVSRTLLRGGVAPPLVV